MNSEMLYAFLMGTGWFFLVGWLLALMFAYAKAFREEQTNHWTRTSVKTAGMVRGAQTGKLP